MMDKVQALHSNKILVTVDEDLRELVPGYLENRRKDIAEIIAALNRNDFETIRSLGHKMKGSGGGYGFDEISEIGRIFEEAAKKADVGQIRDQANRLQNYIDNVEIIFE